MPSNKLKFPLLENIDYIDLIKNKTTHLSLTGSQVNGMTWRDFQMYIGKKLPAQPYFYVLKLKNDSTIFKGQVKAIGSITKEKQHKSDTVPSDLSKAVDSLTKKVDAISGGGGVSVDMLLEITKNSYQMQLNFLNSELVKKDSEIERLLKNIETLNDELDNADLLIEDLKGKTDMSQYMKVVKDIFATKQKTAEPASNLSSVDNSNIPNVPVPEVVPDDVASLMKRVDWASVPEETKKQMFDYMETFT